MTRGQRVAHVRIWALVSIFMLGLIGAALIVRERVAEASARFTTGRS